MPGQDTHPRPVWSVYTGLDAGVGVREESSKWGGLGGKGVDSGCQEELGEGRKTVHLKWLRK